MSALNGRTETHSANVLEREMVLAIDENGEITAKLDDQPKELGDIKRMREEKDEGSNVREI